MRNRLFMLICAFALLGSSTGCDMVKDLVSEDCDDSNLLCDPLTQYVTVTAPVDIPIKFIEMSNPPEFEVGRLVEFNLPPIYVSSSVAKEGYDRLPDGIRSRVRSVEIAAVTLIIEESSLEVPLRPVEFRVGPRVERSVDALLPLAWFDDAIEVAHAEEIEPGFVGEFEMPLNESNVSRISGQISEFDFGMGIRFGTATDAGVMPQGSAGVQVELKLRFKLRA